MTISRKTLPPLASIPPAMRETIQQIISFEGTRFENDVDDPGGATQCGISLAFAKAARIDLNGDGLTTLEDIRDVEEDDATRIIYSEFLLKPGLDKAPPSFQPFLLDTAFNCGLGGLETILRNAIPKPYSGIPGDGLKAALVQLSQASRDKIFLSDTGSRLLDMLVQSRIIRYKSIAERRPQSRKFLNGWLLRALYFGSRDLRSRYKDLLASYHQRP